MNEQKMLRLTDLHGIPLWIDPLAIDGMWQTEGYKAGNDPWSVDQEKVILTVLQVNNTNHRVLETPKEIITRGDIEELA